MAIWAAACGTATPNVILTEGTNQATDFTVGAGIPDLLIVSPGEHRLLFAGGPYKLCYRANGGSESVEQTTAGLLTVKAGQEFGLEEECFSQGEEKGSLACPGPPLLNPS